MVSLLIAVIYFAFISLGLPDSLLGSAWPVLHADIGADIAWVGFISMIISVSTIISSLLSDRFNQKFGTGIVVTASVFLTAVSMLAFSFADAFWQLCLLAVPYGFGAGAIDAALNNYVALHYSSRHMNWLHCFWGLGATISPYIMGFCLTELNSWHAGYRTVSYMQFFLAAIMLLAIPLWKKKAAQGTNREDEQTVHLRLPQIVRLPGVWYVFIAFLCYCVYETLPMVWASTYFSIVYSLDGDKAAFFGSLFFIGITVSRFLCGFLSNRLGDRRMIRIGTLFSFCAAFLLFIPTQSYWPAVIGFILIGFGCGPVYPSIIHATPFNFGKTVSGSVIGVQMAFAYTGTTFSPIIFGKLAEWTDIRLLPVMILVFSILCFVLLECLNRTVDRQLIKEA